MHQVMRHSMGGGHHDHAAVQAWLREFEARAFYGIDDRWAWRRGQHALGLRLTLVLLLLVVLGGALVHADPPWGWLLAGALGLALVAHLAVRVMLRPLWLLGWGVAAFGRGDLKHRIPIRRRDEIGALAARFNRMADDIEAMLDGKRSLLLAISHELRSPITRARLNVELLDESPIRTALIQDLGLMRELIEGLLERERLDSGHTALMLQPADWAAWVNDLIARRFAGQPIDVDVAADLPTVQADRMRIELLLGNLLDNALRHNETANGNVRLTVIRERDGVLLTVRDFGAGVPDEALEQLGQPFFRSDSSRSRASGGVGLGLSLCKLIATAHGSSLELRNAQPGLEASLHFQSH